MSQRILIFLLIVVSVFGVARLTDKGRIMTPEITAPYFSGAALTGFSSEWKFNTNEVYSLKWISEIKNDSTRKKMLSDFRFAEKPTITRDYEFNQPGYKYIIAFAKKLFPTMGRIDAVKLLQLLVHSLFCFLILISLSGSLQKWIFYFLYIINPLIIYYAVFPFYYFWQAIPSFILILVLLNKKLHKSFLLVVFAVALAFLFHTRLSTIAISALVFVCGFYTLSWIKRIGGLALMVVLILLMQPSYLSKHPGHIMYVSLGAYPGLGVNSFSDNTAYVDYGAETGKQYSYNTIPCLYDSEVYMGEAKWGMNKYLTAAKTHPLLILRNAGLNFFESFSVGYVTKSLMLSYLSALAGLVFFILLLMKKKKMEIFFIVASVCTYIFYLPPVPVYMYGTYVLLVFALLSLLPKKEHVSDN